MRLNKVNRQVILERLVERAFKSRVADLAALRKVLARQMYDVTIKAQHKDILNVVGSFPIEWQHHTGGVIVERLVNSRLETQDKVYRRSDTELTVYRYKARRSVATNHWEFGDSLRLIPIKSHVSAYNQRFLYITLPEGSPELAEISRLEEQAFELLADMAKFEEHAFGILNAANTRAQLLSVWPEVADLVPEPEKKVKPLSLVDPAMIMALNATANLNTMEPDK